MGLSIGELFVSLGFDVDDGKLKSFNEGIKTASGELLKLTAIATGGLYSLNAFLEGSINRAFGIKNFSTETGQATEGLQRFQSVVNQVNASISTQEAAAKYRALADAMTDITQQGGGGALARLTGGAFHIGMKEEDVIEAIRNYKQRFIAENGGDQIGVAAHARLLEQIGLGAGSERAFDMSSDQYRAMSDFAVRSQSAIDGAARLGSTIALLEQEWDKFKDDLAGEWSTPLINSIRAAEEWIKDFMKSAQAIIDVWRQWPAAIKDGSEILLAVLAVWAVPFGTTLAVVTAIAAAIWDIGRAIRGLPSLTGTVFDYFMQGAHAIGKGVSNWGGLPPLAPTKYTSDKPFEYLMGGPGGSNTTVTQNVTAHITATANAQQLVEEFMRRNQQSLNTTLLSLAGSPAY